MREGIKVTGLFMCMLSKVLNDLYSRSAQIPIPIHGRKVLHNPQAILWTPVRHPTIPLNSDIIYTEIVSDRVSVLQDSLASPLQMTLAGCYLYL